MKMFIKMNTVMVATIMFVLLAIPLPAEAQHNYDDHLVSAGAYHTVGLKSDGIVIATGRSAEGQCDVSGWSDIQQVSAGCYHTVGLKSDGTVVATGTNFYGQCNVSGWSGMQQISAGDHHTVGLKNDGTVVATGWNPDGQCNVSGWSGIKQVSAGVYNTIGLKNDGTVVAIGDNGYGRCDVSGWSGIKKVAAGLYHTVGLKSDGTVVATGDNAEGQCNVSGWSDIQQVSAGGFHTVGLKSDGTVVATGGNDSSQCDVNGWSDIQQVSAGFFLTVGLKIDGTVVATGDNDYGQCDVSDWVLLITQMSQYIGSTGSYYFGELVNSTIECVFFTASGTITITVHPDEFYPGTALDTVKRWFEITSTAAGSFNLTLSYAEGELYSENEGILKLWRNSGNSWFGPYGTTVDTVNNTVTANGVTEFSAWVIADNPSGTPPILEALPIFLISIGLVGLGGYLWVRKRRPITV